MMIQTNERLSSCGQLKFSHDAVFHQQKKRETNNLNDIS